MFFFFKWESAFSIRGPPYDKSALSKNNKVEGGRRKFENIIEAIGNYVKR